MKKFLTVLAGIVLGAVIFAAGAITLLWLFCDNNVSINLSNHSGTQLHKVAVVVPGSPFSGSPHEMPPTSDFAFSAETRTRLPIRVVFDADGRHYDLPAQVRLAPFGSFVVSISIDERFQISIKTIFV